MKYISFLKNGLCIFVLINFKGDCVNKIYIILWKGFFMTLRKKIFLAYTIIIIVPLLSIAIAVHYIFSDSKIEDVTENAENLLKQFNSNMDILIKDASRATLSILYNKELIEILKEYESSDLYSYQKKQHINAFSIFLSGIVFDNEKIHGVHVFSKNGQVFSQMNNHSVKSKIDLASQHWYELAKEANGSWVIISEEAPSYYKNNKNEFLSIVRLLRNPADKKEVGIIKMDFSPSHIEKLTEQLVNKHWGVTINNNILIKTNESKQNLLKECTNNHSWIKDAKTNSEYICVLNKSDFTKIQVSNVIPKKVVYQEIIEFDILLITLIILFVIISLILSYFTSNHLIKPLTVLKKQIKGIYKETKYDNVPSEKDNEVRILSKAYNHMLSEIKDLVKKTYELNQRAAESEYKALQSKMDPHFLFNTLETISMTAIKNNQLEISDMLTDLAKLIRYRLKSDEQLVTIEDELAFCKIYISLMKHRMQKDLSVDFHIDNSLNKKRIPKYMLQPLIENSVIHGKGEKHLFVSIEIVRKGGCIVFNIEDNGIGISKKRQSEIFSHLKKKENQINNELRKRGVGIALVNILKRIKLIYGENAELTIESELGKGTIVTIIIPNERRNWND